MAIDTTFLRRTLTCAAVAALGPILGACTTTDRDATGSVYPYNFRDRHPITLADGPRTLDVFVQGRDGLVSRERQDVADFMGEYRTHGNGPIAVQVPAHVWNQDATRRALARIRDAAGGRLVVSRYEPADPEIASPIRLTFRRLQAKVAGRCGLWPQDLGVGDFEEGTQNQPYWNNGCAYQSNFASQVAEPVDLVRARRETPPDTEKRMHGIKQLRGGQDPATDYKQDGKNKINQTVAN